MLDVRNGSAQYLCYIYIWALHKNAREILQHLLFWILPFCFCQHIFQVFDKLGSRPLNANESLLVLKCYSMHFTVTQLLLRLLILMIVWTPLIQKMDSLKYRIYALILWNSTGINRVSCHWFVEIRRNLRLSFPHIGVHTFISVFNLLRKELFWVLSEAMQTQTDDDDGNYNKTIKAAYLYVCCVCVCTNYFPCSYSCSVFTT